MPTEQSPTTPFPSEQIEQAKVQAIDNEILATKAIRIACDKTLQELVKPMPLSREIALCRTKLEEAIMWAGMNLKRLNDGKTCYENSYKMNTIVEPMRDGVKL